MDIAELTDFMHSTLEDFQNVMNRMNAIVSDNGILSDDDFETISIANSRAKGAMIVLRVLNQYNGTNEQTLKAMLNVELGNAIQPQGGNLHVATTINNVLFYLN